MLTSRGSRVVSRASFEFRYGDLTACLIGYPTEQLLWVSTYRGKVGEKGSRHIFAIFPVYPGRELTIW